MSYQLTNTGAEVQTLLDQEDVRTWGEYQQTDSQAVGAASSTKLTCDGVELDNFSPSGGTEIWNTTTSEGSLVSGAWYSLQFDVSITAGTNNTTVIFEVVDASDGTTVLYSQEGFIARTAVSEPVSASFFFKAASTLDFQLNLLVDKAVTVDDVIVLTKREL